MANFSENIYKYIKLKVTENQIDRDIKISDFPFVASKGIIRAFKAFIKRLEVPQRREKTKI